MPDSIFAITGATGGLGSHVAQQLVERGERVRCLVRPNSDTRFLSTLNVEQVQGDLLNRVAVEKLVEGVTQTIHCAAKTDNWGPMADYRRENCDTTRHLVDACKSMPQFRRFVHLSSVAVYGHPHLKHGQCVTEEAELGQHPWRGDHYSQSKIEAEQIVRTLGPRATIVRPTSFFGERDLSFLPRIMRSIRNGGMWLFGNGNNPLNLLHVADVASLAITAARSDAAAGQVYNCCARGDMTQRQLIERLCEEMRLPVVRRRLPLPLAYQIARIFEAAGKASGRKQSPKLTRHALSVFVRPTFYSTEKAERELGWQKSVSIDEGIGRTLLWLRQTMPDLF